MYWKQFIELASLEGGQESFHIRKAIQKHNISEILNIPANVYHLYKASDFEQCELITFTPNEFPSSRGCTSFSSNGDKTYNTMIECCVKDNYYINECPFIIKGKLNVIFLFVNPHRNFLDINVGLFIYMGLQKLEFTITCQRLIYLGKTDFLPDNTANLIISTALININSKEMNLLDILYQQYRRTIKENNIKERINYANFQI